MNVLIVGSGGREHALGWKISMSPSCGTVFFAPGNGGTSTRQGFANVNLKDTEIEKLADFAEENGCFTVVGTETPLSLGITDLFRQRDLPVFGPDKNSAMLETSKSFAKSFMKKYKIPTASYEEYISLNEAAESLRNRAYPIWVKADGLAAGKGAVFCATERSANSALISMMRNKKYGASGEKVVIEEHMEGKEMTLMCLTDGESILKLSGARDYKRAYDMNAGPNTGGMGSVSPVETIETWSVDEIINKTLNGIKTERLDYRGVLYFELMLNDNGAKVIEYNARFGDPETQALLPRMTTDLLLALHATAMKHLSDVAIKWSDKTSVCVAAVSDGYPGEYETGKKISLPDEVNADEGLYIFHSGTKLANGELRTNGGRVISVTALGNGITEARERAYRELKKINFEGMRYRNDIGL